MLALRTSPPTFGIAEGERIARDLYGLAVAATGLPGERDCNFRVRGADGREFVLKILALTDSQSIDCLVRVLGHLAEQDRSLSVPRLFPTSRGEELGVVTRDGGDYATCLLSFLPGRLLADSTPDTALLQNVGETLARVDRALQGFFHPALARRLAWDIRRLPELAEFSRYIASPALRLRVENTASALRASLPALRGLKCQAIHGDCHATNLLVDPGGLSICGILDFGDMIHAPRIFEPAVAMSELMTERIASLDDAAAVLSGYARAQCLEAGEVELLHQLITARHAITLLLHAWRSVNDLPGARLLAEAAMRAGDSLDRLQSLDAETLTQVWHAQAATLPPRRRRTAAPPGMDMARRHRLLGAGAELFYERPLHLVRGAGVWLYDAAGNAYLDAYNNVPHVGHTHPAVVGAIRRQTAILATHTRYLHESILEYAEQLTSRLPRRLNACIFVNSGSEANDVAWRIAQMASGNRGALVMEHAYHGITDAVAALTPGKGAPRDPWVVTLAPPPDSSRAGEAMDPSDLAAAQRQCESAIAALRQRGFAPAAFYLDTGITSSGIFDPPPAWAAAVAAPVRAAGGLIVADEVQYGLGRCGSHFWGFERRGLDPDIVTLGKPVGNGYPMGVVIAKRELIEAFQATHGFFSTFGGNAVAAAAGLAVLEVLERESLMANAAAAGDYLREKLQTVAARHACLGSVRGAGLLLGLNVLAPDAAAAKRHTKRIVNILASEFRVLIGSEGPHGSVLKLRPPMPFRLEHADLLASAIDAAASVVDADGA